jgi:2'-5' RNA ligase
MGRQHRLFIAVDPPATVAARVRGILDRLREAGVDAAWTDPAHLHLTLHFLGDDVDDADLHRICVAMDESAAAVTGFSTFLAGVGMFPDPRRPRVIWLGVGDGAVELQRLHDALAERLGPLGFPAEARGFRPHLTLGRFRGKARAASGLSGAIEACRDAVAGEMPVRMIALYESRLTKAGAEHDRLHASPLAGGRPTA